jgi:asparagine synthase (glutamine-hydrolysing)
VLTGEGGDELFGGYRRYVAEQWHAVYRAIPRSLRTGAAALPFDAFPPLRRLGRTLRALSVDERGERSAVWIEVFNTSERRELLGGAPGTDPYASYRATSRGANEVATEDTTAMMLLEIQTNLVDGYLEKVDKATMAASLEARVPLLDPRIVELVALAPARWKIQGMRTKSVLRNIAARHVPAATIFKPKQGFGPPLGQWLSADLRDRVRELTDRNAPVNDLLEPRAVQRIVRAFLRGEYRATQVWTLLVLDEWVSSCRMREPLLDAVNMA